MLLFGNNADFTGLGLGVILPVDDLNVYARLGEGDPGSLKNYAYEGDDLTKAGQNPSLLVFTDTYVETRSGGNRYLETGIAESDEWTMIVVGNHRDAGISGEDRGFYIGNYGSSSGTRVGVGLTANEGGSNLILANGANAAKIVSIAATNSIQPHFYAATLGGGMATIYNFTDDLSTSVADDRATPTKNTGTTVRIGSSGSGSLYYGYSRQYFAAFAPRSLNAEELGRVYDQARAYLAMKGVSI